jgi:hypothetical protein
MSVATAAAVAGQNPLPDFVVQLPLRVEVESPTGSQQP